MDSSQLIQSYLKKLDEESRKRPLKNWYKTHLANKHRFYPNTERLMSLLQHENVELESLSFFKILKNTFFFLIKFGWQLALIKKREHQKIRELKTISHLNVVKTFSYDHSFKNGFTDPFLGDLHRYLKEQNRNVIIIHEHLGKFDTYLSSDNKKELINLYAFINWKDYFIQFIFLFVNCFRNENRASDKISSFIQDNYRKEILEAQFYLHDMHFHAFKNLMTYFNVTKIYSSFENNAWEKMLILARNLTKKPIEVIAHQHVPIAPSALNYYVTPSEISLLPDRIVTIGIILRDFLLGLGYPAEKIRAGCALRLNLSEYPLPKNTQRLSLVALDGIPQAAAALNSILRNIRFFKSLGWKFIVRFHPVLNLEGMSPYLIEPLHHHDIFEISHSSLAEDILKTDSVFYWGSSVAFEAMYSGRIVIHTPGPETLSNDPITLYGGLHFVANDMEATISAIIKMSEEELLKRRVQSKEYCQKYFGAIGPQNLKSFD